MPSLDLPSTNLIPDKLINAKVYQDGEKALLGISDVELPSIEYITETMAGLGIAGELDSPVTGHTKAMTVKFKWASVSQQAITLLRTETHTLDIRASVQRMDAGTGKFSTAPLRLALRALPKKSGLGKAEPAKKMDADTEMEVAYLKMWIGGDEVLEIDKLNFIFRILGEDVLADVRSDLGMES